MRRNAIQVMILVVCSMIAFSCATTKQAQNDIFSKVAGTWEWKERIGTKKRNFHSISFSVDNKIAYFTKEMPFKGQDGDMKSFYTYNILSHDENTITMFLNGETRKTDSGDLVVWILVLKDADVYCWRRTDWKPTACTKEIYRIKS